MRLANGTSIGLSTIVQLIIIIGAIALVVWRLAEGDSLEDASAWIGGAIAAVTAVAMALNRAWQSIEESKLVGGDPGPQDGVGELPEDTVPEAPEDAA